MSKKITFCAMMAVLGIISILVPILLPSNTIFFYLFSTLFTYICTEEYGMKYGILTYVAISLAGFMLTADKISVIAYAVAVGYYPVVKHFIEHLEIKNILKRMCKIVFATAVVFIAWKAIQSFVVINISVWFALPIALVIFIVYDIVLTVGIKFYALKLRKLR